MVAIILSFVVVSILLLILSIRADKKIRNMPLKKQHNYPLVSIVIPSYKSAGKLEKTLKSVKGADYPKKEIIVVNDGADAAVTAVCRQFGVKVIQTERRGKGAALNHGIKYAKGEYVLFLDADTTMGRATLTTLFNSYKSYEESGDKIGMIAPAYTARNKRNIFSRFTDMEQSVHQNIIKIQMNFKSILSTRGCCLLLTKKVFNKAGGFSKTLLEDGDFAAKVIKAGYNIKYEPRAVVKTGEPESFKSLMRSKRRYGKGTLYCLLNNKTPYLNSIQSAICFYPFAILGLAFFGLYLFHNLLYAFPLLLLLTTITVNGTFSFFYTAIAILIVSAISFALGSAFSYQGSANAGITAHLTSVAIFSALAIPVTYAYFRGGLSGIIDKAQKKPELILSDW